jgi:UDP-N-acetyl-D-galactosamine dehydrogenase
MAEGLGVTPQVILAGRRINDNMSTFVAQKIIKMLLNEKNTVKTDLRIGICGVTFKEDVPDLRNSKVMDLVRYLEEFGIQVFCVDPVADAKEFHDVYQRNLTSWKDMPTCDALVFAVKHTLFKQEMSLEKIHQKLRPESKILVDLKALYDPKKAEDLGLKVWRL